MTNLDNIRVLFDNGGGVLIVAPNYAHGYSNGTRPAEDVYALLGGGDIDQWDGNDEELLGALADDEIEQYERVYTVSEIADLLANPRKLIIEEDQVFIHDGQHHSYVSGYSEAEFFRSLVQKMDAEK